MSNVQFRKTVDPVISRLIDPARGYVLTCIRCNKHMKEEAVAAHLCEGEKIEAEGIEFVRDASMRYRCTICNVTVPIVLVRAHAVRHPKPRLEEEEWSDICGVMDKSKPGFVAAKKPGPDSKAQEEKPAISTKLVPSNEAGDTSIASSANTTSGLTKTATFAQIQDQPTVPSSQMIRAATSAQPTSAPLMSSPQSSKPASSVSSPKSTLPLNPLTPKIATSIPQPTTVHPVPSQSPTQHTPATSPDPPKPQASAQISPSEQPQKSSAGSSTSHYIKPPLATPSVSKPSEPEVQLPSQPSPSVPRPILSMSTIMSTELRGKRQSGEVSYCLRKVRKVELSFVRVFRVYGRASYCRELSAFQHWRKASKR